MGAGDRLRRSVDGFRLDGWSGRTPAAILDASRQHRLSTRFVNVRLPCSFAHRTACSNNAGRRGLASVLPVSIAIDVSLPGSGDSRGDESISSVVRLNAWQRSHGGSSRNCLDASWLSAIGVVGRHRDTGTHPAIVLPVHPARPHRRDNVDDGPCCAATEFIAPRSDECDDPLDWTRDREPCRRFRRSS